MNLNSSSPSWINPGIQDSGTCSNICCAMKTLAHIRRSYYDLTIDYSLYTTNVESFEFTLHICLWTWHSDFNIWIREMLYYNCCLRHIRKISNHLANSWKSLLPVRISNRFKKLILNMLIIYLCIFPNIHCTCVCKN